ncbi:DNA alkylation repair protein [Candidatus Latescibacterota bacterium]
MNEKDLYRDIQQYCVTHADNDIVKKYSRFFKEGYDAYGLSSELLEKKVDSILSDDNIDIDLVLKTSVLLVKSGKYEETFFAILLLKHYAIQFTRETFNKIGKWFETGIINWAHTDVLCGKIIHPFFDRNLIALEDFSDWRTAENKYQRRAVPVSMLSLLESTDDFAPLFAFIEPLMTDPERVVQQGLGWFLREAWKIKKDETETFLLKWKNDAPRVIYQYATEKMNAKNKERFRKEKKKVK